MSDKTLQIRLAVQPGQPLDDDTVRRFLTSQGIDVTKPLDAWKEGDTLCYEGYALPASVPA